MSSTRPDPLNRYLGSSVRIACLPAGYFVPVRDFPAADNVPNDKNLNPRVSGTYDLFGNGKTAVKASIGRYVPWLVGTIGNPQSGQPGFATVTWNDSFYGAGDPRTGNFVPDCDLHNIDGSGECGPWSDRGFGQVRAGTRFAEDAITGFNRQQYTGKRRCRQRCGFFDVKPSLFGRVDNVRTQASNYGRRPRSSTAWMSR